MLIIQMFHDQKVVVKSKYCLHLVCWDLVVGLKGSAKQTPPGIENVNIEMFSHQEIT